MHITKIEAWDFSPVFRDGPYAMSFVVQERLYGRILNIHTADGLQGAGEIVLSATLTPEERQACIDSEDAYLRPLIGQEIDALLTMAEKLRAKGKSWHGIAFGLETAYFDNNGRRQNKPAADLLGSTKARSINDYFSISERTVDKIEARMQIAGPDRAVIQLKLGVGSLHDDITQVKAALAAMNANQTLLADANGGWTIEEACHVISQFDDPRLLWEEPCMQYAENRAVSTKTERRLMFDTCVGSLEMAKQAVQAPQVAAICIKPALLGGLTVAQQVRNLCAAAGVKMRIDGPWCGDIASAAILHLALGAPADLLIAGCDLREPLTINPDLHGVVSLPGARIAPPNGVGLGMNDISEQLGKPEKVYA
ncbi:MAG: mandelate racemase/muconate lactonizing enzyme family protein [Chloroflexota bacterium]